MDSSAESDTKKDKKEDDDEYGLMENFAAENANCSDTSSGPSGAEVEPEQDALSSSEVAVPKPIADM